MVKTQNITCKGNLVLKSWLYYVVVFPNKKQNISFHCVNMGSNEWQCYHLNLMDYNVSLCAAVVFLLVCCSRFKVFFIRHILNFTG